FVLTLAGADAARLLRPETGLLQLDIPHYDLDLRKLWFRDRLVKWFRQPATDQGVILSSFEEEHWKGHIYSPLSPHNGDEEPKLRLRRAVRRLNRHQIHQSIRFRAASAGEGIS